MSGPGERDDDAGEPAPHDDQSPDTDHARTSRPDGEGTGEPTTNRAGGDKRPDQLSGPSQPSQPRPREQSGRPARRGPRPDAPTQPGDQAEEDGSWVLVTRDVVITVLAVALVGGYLFAISGVWPPMVAIESGSMEPNMNVNDMVFVMDNDRFQPEPAQGDTGIVTAKRGAEAGYTQYGKPGDVIIFEPGGRESATPIIHRAMLWVEEDENWYERANKSYVGSADSCQELSACPAPNAGFITKGDANTGYDQASFGGSNAPVKSEWIVGTAEVRIPRLGWFRLQF